MPDHPTSGAFGEPWKALDTGYVIDSNGGVRAFNLLPEPRNRIADCVSALAGIRDPEAFVKAVGELVEAARIINSKLRTSGMDEDLTRRELSSTIIRVETLLAANKKGDNE